MTKWPRRSRAITTQPAVSDFAPLDYLFRDLATGRINGPCARPWNFATAPFDSAFEPKENGSRAIIIPRKREIDLRLIKERDTHLFSFINSARISDGGKERKIRTPRARRFSNVCKFLCRLRRYWLFLNCFLIARRAADRPRF